MGSLPTSSGPTRHSVGATLTHRAAPRSAGPARVRPPGCGHAAGPRGGWTLGEAAASQGHGPRGRGSGGAARGLRSGAAPARPPDCRRCRVPDPGPCLQRPAREVCHRPRGVPPPAGPLPVRKAVRPRAHPRAGAGRPASSRSCAWVSGQHPPAALLPGLSPGVPGVPTSLPWGLCSPSFVTPRRSRCPLLRPWARRVPKTPGLFEKPPPPTAQARACVCPARGPQTKWPSPVTRCQGGRPQHPVSRVGGRWRQRPEVAVTCPAHHSHGLPSESVVGRVAPAMQGGPGGHWDGPQ